MISSSWQIAGVGLATSALYLFFQSYNRRRASLPPGPKGFPLIGNFYDVPKTEEWLTFMEMSRTYDSDVISLNLMGETIIVLNSPTAAEELLDSRSAIYSDRPAFPMVADLSVKFYESPSSSQRKAMVKQFQPSEVLLHRPGELQAARVLLDRLLDSPRKFEKHLRHMAGMVILSTAYGIEVQPEDDPYIAISEKALSAMAAAGNRGTFLVDSFPFLKYVPAFMPGAGFKTKARGWRKVVSSMPDVPYNFVKESLAAGTAKSSIASRFLEELYEHPSVNREEQEVILKSILASCYAAGADTTVSTLGTFILAMTMYPEVQKEAQSAIDKVLGPAGTRLPDFDDMYALPYINGIMRECLRWRPVVPLGFFHATTEADTYRGYVIPAGSVIIPNTWAIMRDKVFGPKPDEFHPERWLTETGQINTAMCERDAAFGYGRRICVGKDMAEWSMWITITSILAVFNITKSLDANGVPIEPSGKYTSGLLIYPMAHDCDILPRSEAARALIKATLQATLQV
ncbi:cytochrome P450 [Mycena filopes]|nr:cytochrome P450 [Mycena filopes]